jgi:hypothetical protein
MSIGNLSLFTNWSTNIRDAFAHKQPQVANFNQMIGNPGVMQFNPA